MSAAGRSHLSPVLRSVGVPDFSGPGVFPHLTASGLPGDLTCRREGTREGRAELSRTHGLAFATLGFRQPPSPSSWGLRAAAGRTHPGPARTLGFPLAWTSGRRLQLQFPATSTRPLSPGSPTQAGLNEGWTGQLGGWLKGPSKASPPEELECFKGC